MNRLIVYFNYKFINYIDRYSNKELIIVCFINFFNILYFFKVIKY